MTAWVIYDEATGAIDSLVRGPAFVVEGLGEGQAAIEMELSSPEGYYIENGQAIEMPPRPSTRHYFDYANKTWAITLEDAKALRWEEIKQAREASEFGQLTWNGYVFDVDEVSQRRIQGAVQMSLLDSDFTVNWTLADNTSIAITGAEMQQIGAALATHVAQCHERSRVLRSAVEAAATVAEVELVVWDD